MPPADKSEAFVNISVQVPAGPRLSVAYEAAIEAYDWVDIVVPAKAGDTDGQAQVEIQPTTLSSQIAFFCIAPTRKLDNKDATTGAVSVEFGPLGSAQQASNVLVTLDAPLILLGSGAATLMGAKIPTILTFKNTTNNAVGIQILVGRKAITKAS